MRRKDKQIDDKNIINSILMKADVCRIGLCDGNIPYIVPMNFGFDEHNLYLHSAREGRKIDIIKNNNNVCFEVETDVELVKSNIACNWGAKYYSVIGKGKAFIVEEYSEKIKALEFIMRKYSGEKEFVFDEERVNRVSIIKIQIEDMTGKKSGY